MSEIKRRLLFSDMSLGNFCFLEQLTEGNFLTELVAKDSLKSELQSEQIISCKREGSQVG